MGHSIGDGLIVLAIAFGLVAWLYLRSRERQKRMEAVHQERLAAMDKGIPLPELLTSDQVLAAFDRAGGRGKTAER